MKLEKFEKGALGLVQFFLVIERSALANRVAAQAFAAARDGKDTQKAPSKEDVWAQAVNDCILTEFPPIYEAVVKKEGLIPLTDPDFDLLTADMKQDIRVLASLQTLPELTLGMYTGFTETVQEREPREVQRELYINQHYGDEARAKAGDEAAIAALHEKVRAELIEKGHALAVQLAEQRLVMQLGEHVQGELPKEFVREHYYAEKQRFGIQMQSKKLSLDMYLEQRGQTVEEFRAEMRVIAEKKLRAHLGLLLVAKKEGLLPSEEAVEAAFDVWLAKKPKDKTFEANDRQKIYRRLCQENATTFIVTHSTLIGR